MPTNTDWQTDPVLRDAMIAGSARGDLIRSALIWTPPFLILLGLLLFFTFDRATGPNYGGTWFLVGVLAVFTFLTGFLAVASWRDLTGGPQELTGPIMRHWSRRDSLVLTTRYIRVADKILRVHPVLHSQLGRGDLVRVEYYPHSGIAIRVEVLPPPEDEEEDEESVFASDRQELRYP